MTSSKSNTLSGARFELDIKDGSYPHLLKTIDNPPQRLYGIGNPEVLIPGIAVIGARKATPYGLAATRRFARRAAMRGVPIISGGARGCDQEAHRAALDAGVPTVVVFGSGADVVYPKRGRTLFQEIIESGGAVISENPWGSPPAAYTFRKRNRIIAGMATILVIAEAGMPSGTFSTADAALQADRIVAAVPGSITSPYSKGTNHLIMQGAQPVVDEEALDVAIDMAFAHFPLSVSEPLGSVQGVEQWEKLLMDDPLLAALSAEAFTPSELSAYFGYSVAELSLTLSRYEIQGLVERGLDGRYQAVRGIRKAREKSRS